jgi:3-oxoacyl-[acyl-carrier protein] reductase
MVDIRGAEDSAAELRLPGHAVRGLAVDITRSMEVEEAVQNILQKEGRIDILVNNAGIIARGTILDLTDEVWQSVMDVNITGAFYWCRAVLPGMIRNHGGRIVNVSSIAGKMGDITAAPVYGTSKGALNTLTKSLARHAAEYGITVNALAPHAIETDMSAQWSKEKRKGVIESIPLGRMGTPGEVAAAALFLASEDAAFITGEVLNINGGYLMD